MVVVVVLSSGQAAAVSMSAEERARYEDVKVKLRTAMADPKLIDELEQVRMQLALLSTC